MSDGRSAILEARRLQRERLLDRARAYVAALDADVLAAVVFGSVGRGDFNVWSDVDLLVIARSLPPTWRERSEWLPPRPPYVQPIAWTLDEWREQLSRSNPIATESVRRGVWLHGSVQELHESTD